VDLALLPGLLGTLVPLLLIALAYWKARSLLLSCGLFLAISVNLISLGAVVPVALANPDIFYLHNTAQSGGKAMDTTIGAAATTLAIAGNTSQWWYTTATYPSGSSDGSVASGTWTLNLTTTAVTNGNSVEMTAWICPNSLNPCTTQVAQRACAVVAVGNLVAYTLTPNPAALTSLPAPANSNRIGLQVRTCNNKSITVQYDGGANAASNLSTPAVTVPDATLWLLPVALAAPLVIRRVRAAAPAVVS
jgi:hypothetical protein